MNLTDFKFYASMGGHYVTTSIFTGGNTEAHLKRKSFSSREEAEDAVIAALKLLEMYTEPIPYQTYTVWVGGTEVNDYLMTLARAQRIAEEYTQDGFKAEIVNTAEK